MSDTKLLQSILDGQVQIRKELKETRESLEKKVEANGKRIDKLGLQIAKLEDDAPTREEFEELKQKVATKLASV